MFRYVTSIYFVTTTATTVGYGDYFAANSWEKLYLLFLEFTGICTFSVITGNITGLKSQRKIADIIEQKVKRPLFSHFYNLLMNFVI